MSRKDQKRISVNVSKEYYEKLRFLSVVHDMTMKEIVLKGIDLFEEHAELKQENRNLKHKLYRAEYDSYEKE